MPWAAIITTVVTVVLAIVKSLWGTDKPVVTTVVNVEGEPIGPTLAEKLRKLAAAGLLMFCVAGCGLTVGPKVEDRIVFIKHQGIAARVAESKKVNVLVEKDGKTYTQSMDIGGFYVISPDMKTESGAAK